MIKLWRRSPGWDSPCERGGLLVERVDQPGGFFELAADPFVLLLLCDGGPSELLHIAYLDAPDLSIVKMVLFRESDLAAAGVPVSQHATY